MTLQKPNHNMLSLDKLKCYEMFLESSQESISEVFCHINKFEGLICKLISTDPKKDIPQKLCQVVKIEKNTQDLFL